MEKQPENNRISPEESALLYQAHAEMLDPIETAKRRLMDVVFTEEALLTDDNLAIRDDYIAKNSYLLQFGDEIEGASLNPELSEHNFDSSLVLTWMLRNRVTCPNKQWPEEISWYRDKYEKSAVLNSSMPKPANVVRAWLRNLGPHNDMHGAAEDLRLARSWLLEDKEVKGSLRNDGLLADIAIELSMIDEENRSTLLREAAAFTEKSRNESLLTGDYGEAAAEQARLASIRIELTRYALTGTHFLTDIHDPSQYVRLQKIAVKEFKDLAPYIELALSSTYQKAAEVMNQQAVVLQQPETDDQIAKMQSQLNSLSNETMKNFGISLEALTYAKLLASEIINQKLATSNMRLGTVRQETGLTHKGVVLADGRVIEDSHNLNFDVEFTRRSEDENNGKLKTLYLQNKTSLPATYSEDKAAEVSKRFFGGKLFRYFEPADLDSDVIPRINPAGIKNILEQVIILAPYMQSYRAQILFSVADFSKNEETKEHSIQDDSSRGK